MELDDGRVLCDSRTICEHLVSTERGKALVPAGLEGATWAYADWADQVLEDVLFRLASPRVRERFATAEERALYTYVKERKFGTGCVDAWGRDSASLAARGRAMLSPSCATLARS